MASSFFTGSVGGAKGNLTLTDKSRVGVIFGDLARAIDNLSSVAKDKIAAIQSKGSAMSIGDMFDLQMIMNKLSQFSEMSTSIMSAMNSAINSLSRNIKG